VGDELPELIRREAEQLPSNERRERVSRQVSGQEKSRPSAQRGCNQRQNVVRHVCKTQQFRKPFSSLRPCLSPLGNVKAAAALRERQPRKLNDLIVELSEFQRGFLPRERPRTL